MKTTKEQSTEANPKAGSQPAAPAQPMLARQLGNAGLLRILQAKLTVSDPQDPFEQEADRVADHVMRMPDVDAGGASAPASPQTTTLQRAADATSSVPVVDAATEGAVAALDGGGRPLSAEIRSFMEPRLGADLSTVRIHTDGQAHDLAHSVSARAFTVGRNVVFGAGHYAPHTDSGRRLIAHELTHTLQQGATTRLAKSPTSGGGDGDGDGPGSRETNITQPYPVIKKLGPYTYSIQEVTDGKTARWRVWNWARTDKSKVMDRGPQNFLDQLVGQARDSGHDTLVLTIENIEADSVKRLSKPGSPMAKHLGATEVTRIDERTVRMVIPLGGKPIADGTGGAPGGGTGGGPAGGAAPRPQMAGASGTRTPAAPSPSDGVPRSDDAVPEHVDDGPSIHRPTTPTPTGTTPPGEAVPEHVDDGPSIHRPQTQSPGTPPGSTAPRTPTGSSPGSSGGSGSTGSGSSGSGSSGSGSSGSGSSGGSSTPSGTTNPVSGRSPVDPHTATPLETPTEIRGGTPTPGRSPRTPDPLASTPLASTPLQTPTEIRSGTPSRTGSSPTPDPLGSTPVASTPVASSAETLTRVQPGTPPPVSPGNLFKRERSAPAERLAPAVERVSVDQWVHIEEVAEDDGVNKKYIITTAAGEKWLFKPATGESGMEFGPELGIQRGERWRRALAAAYLAQDLGLNTPYVQLIEVGHGSTGPSGLSAMQRQVVGMVGSLQEWRQGYEARPGTPKPVEYARLALYPAVPFVRLTRPELEAMVARLSPRIRPTVESLQQLQARQADFDRFWNSRFRHDIDAFDYFIANQDRHKGNVMIRREDDDRPSTMLIDQDSGIPASPERFSRARSQDELKGWQRDLPPSVSKELADRFHELAADFPEAELRKWLTQKEVDGLRSRLNEVIVALNDGRIGTIEESPDRAAETAQPVSGPRRTGGGGSVSSNGSTEDISTGGTTRNVSTGATTEDAETRSVRSGSSSRTPSPTPSRSPGSGAPTASETSSAPDTGTPKTQKPTAASSTPPSGDGPLPKAAATIAPGPQPWGGHPSDVHVTAADAISVDKTVERQTPQGPRQTGMSASASGHALTGEVRTGGPGRQTTGAVTVTAQDVAVEFGKQKPGKGGPTAGVKFDSQGNITFEAGWSFQTKGGSSIKPTFSHGTRVEALEPIELEDGRFVVVYQMTDTTTVGVGGSARRAPQGGFGFSAGGNVSQFEAESKQGTRIFKRKEDAEAFRSNAAFLLTYDPTTAAPSTAADALKIPVGETRGQSDTEGRNLGLSGSFGGTTLGRNYQKSETTGVSFYRKSDDLLNVTTTVTQDKSKDWGIAGGILANQKGGDTTHGFGVTLQFNISTPEGRGALDLYLKTRIPPLGAKVVGVMTLTGDGDYDRYQLVALGTAEWNDRSWQKITRDEEGVIKEFGGEQVHKQDPTWLAELTGDRKLYSSAQLVSQQIHGKEKYTAIINIKSEDGEYNREEFGKIFMGARKKTPGKVTQSGEWTLSADIDKKVVHELEQVSSRFKDAKNQDDKQKILSEVFRKSGAGMAGGLVRSGGRFMLAWDLELKGDPNFPGPAGREKLAMQREELAKKLKASPASAAQVVRETQAVLNQLWARREKVRDEKNYTDLPDELRKQQVALIDRHMYEFDQVRSNALMAAGRRDPNESIQAIRARLKKPDAYDKLDPEKREKFHLQDKVADEDASVNETRQKIEIALEAVRRARVQDNIPEKYKKHYMPSRIALKEADALHKQQAELGYKVQDLRVKAFNAADAQATEAWRQLEDAVTRRYTLLNLELDKINDAGKELVQITKPESRWGARYDDFWAPIEQFADEPDEDYVQGPVSMALEEPKKPRRGRRR